MSDVALLDDDFSKGVRGLYGFAISPQFERARAARDPKPVQEAAKPIAVEAPQPLIRTASNTEVRSYDDLISALRARADQLAISREAISELAGLPDRYAAKVLSLGQVKRIGMASLGPLLGALSLKLIVISDDEALERNRGHYATRDAAHLKSANARWSPQPGQKPPRRARTPKR
jgi:hypothetical protein